MTNSPPSVPEGPDRDSQQHADGDLTRRIIRSSAWVGLGWGGGQLIAFASTLALARLLTPAEFGAVALAMILLFALQALQESGAGSALVYGNYDLRVAAASVLVFTSLAGVALAVVTLLVAPLYAQIFHLPEATEIVRVLSLVLVFRGLMVVPNALLERDLNFRARTKSELAFNGVQAIVAVSCAFAGLGAWSLVAGQLSGSAVQLVVLWLLVPWRPDPRAASWQQLRPMLRYGRYVAGANVTNFVNSTVDNMLVGRIVGAAALGLYAAAWRLAEIPNVVIGFIVGRVMFAVYSRIQDDLAAVRQHYLANIQRTVLLALPLTVGMGIAAEPIVAALLGQQWQGAVLPLRILAVFGFVRLITAPSGDLLRGTGRSALGFAGSTLFLVLAVSFLLVLVPRHGTAGAATAMVIAIVLTDSVMMTLVFRTVQLRPLDFLRALARPMLPSIPVALTLLALVPATSDANPLLALGLLLLGGGIAYCVGVALFARPLAIPIWAALRRA